MNVSVIYVYIISVVLFFTLFFFLYTHNKMTKLVQKLNKDGWVVFLNANNCGFCTEQIKFFGGYFSRVNTIHCDDVGNKDACKDITAFPTWKSKGQVYRGGKFSLPAFEKLFNEARGSKSNDSS